MDGSVEDTRLLSNSQTSDPTNQQDISSPTSQITLNMYSQPQISNTRHSMAPSDTASLNGVPGVAFNTTPIYDAQGTLVGVQGPLESGQMGNGEPNAARRNEAPGYMTLPSVYPYNVPQQPVENMSVVNYNPYGAYNATAVQAYSGYPRSQAPFIDYNPQLPSYDSQKAHLLSQGDAMKQADSTVIVSGLSKPNEVFDTCPTVCSLFAILCCPITLWCSLPALLYSMCSYTDYRAADMKRYVRKSDLARNLVITACVVGLLLCLTWAVLAFFYYELILATINDFLRVLQTRMSTSGT